MSELKAQGRDSLEKIIWAALYAQGIDGRRGLPVALVGEPGTAKTSRVKQIAERAGLKFESVLASLRDPTDFLGTQLPKKLPLTACNQHLSPDGDDHIMVTEYAPPSFAIRSAQARRAVVLFDEVNTAPPSVQAALLRVLFEGVCGEFQLPPGVRFLLAMNRVEDSAGGWDVALPLANRMGWLEVDAPSVDRYVEHIQGFGAAKLVPVDARAEEQQVDALWTAAFARAAGEVCGFLSARPDNLHRKPSAAGVHGARAWPSSRTHELSMRGLASCYVYGLSAAEQDMMVAAFVGSGVAGELHTWRKNNDLPSAADFLDGKVKFEHSPARLDRTAAVLTSATMLVVDQACPDRQARAEAFWGFLQTVSDTAADVALGAVVQMCNARLMIGSKLAYKVLARFEPVMSAAAVVPELP